MLYYSALLWSCLWRWCRVSSLTFSLVGWRKRCEEICRWSWTLYTKLVTVRKSQNALHICLFSRQVRCIMTNSISVLVFAVSVTYFCTQCATFLFLARDSIYAIARYMPSPVRPSVCPSLCPSHGWISQRRLKLGSRNLHHRVAPWL